MSGLTEKQKEDLLSIHNAASDVQRWVTSQLAADRVSLDRCTDINRAAQLIGSKITSVEFARR